MFWIDIESLCLGVAVGAFNVVVIKKSERGAFVQEAYDIAKETTQIIDHTQALAVHDSQEDMSVNGPISKSSLEEAIKFSNHRVINDKAYVSLGSLHRKAQTHPEEAREANAVEYTSVPLNVQGLLNSNSPVRQRFNEFQQEIKSLKRDKTSTKGVKKSPRLKKSRSKNKERRRSPKKKSPVKEVWNTTEEKAVHSLAQQT